MAPPQLWSSRGAESDHPPPLGLPTPPLPPSSLPDRQASSAGRLDSCDGGMWQGALGTCLLSLLCIKGEARGDFTAVSLTLAGVAVTPQPLSTLKLCSTASFSNPQMLLEVCSRPRTPRAPARDTDTHPCSDTDPADFTVNSNMVQVPLEPNGSRCHLAQFATL